MKTQWLRPDQAIQPAKLWQRLFVVPRQLYTEIEKKVAVSGVDLWKVIRNERKVLQQKYPIVLWTLKQQAGQQCILFCCIEQQHQARMPQALNVLLPETWLLRFTLTPGVLYRVESEPDYWAYLHANGKLHVTDIAGIMQQPRYFLDALGVQSINQQPEPLQASSLTELTLGQLPLGDIAGLLHYRTSSSGQAATNWPRVAAFFAGTLLIAATAFSAALVWYDGKLTNELAALQREVLSFTEQQDQLSAQRLRLERYETLLNRFPSVASGLALLSKELGDSADLMQAELSGRAIRITGSADSATQILEIMNQQPAWQDARFERSVQRSRQREDFSISLTRREQANQGSAESVSETTAEQGETL